MPNRVAISRRRFPRVLHVLLVRVVQARGEGPSVGPPPHGTGREAHPCRVIRTHQQPARSGQRAYSEYREGQRPRAGLDSEPRARRGQRRLRWTGRACWRRTPRRRHARINEVKREDASARFGPAPRPGLFFSADSQYRLGWIGHVQRRRMRAPAGDRYGTPKHAALVRGGALALGVAVGLRAPVALVEKPDDAGSGEAGERADKAGERGQ